GGRRGERPVAHPRDGATAFFAEEAPLRRTLSEPRELRERRAHARALLGPARERGEGIDLARRDRADLHFGPPTGALVPAPAPFTSCPRASSFWRRSSSARFASAYFFTSSRSRAISASGGVPARIFSAASRALSRTCSRG